MLLFTVANYEVNCLGGFLCHNQHSKCAIWPAESNLKWDDMMQHGSFVNLLLFLPRKENKQVNKEGWHCRQVGGSGKNTDLL